MYIAKYQPPTQSELEHKALNFVRTNKPRYYRELKKSDKLKEHCHRKATKVMSYAKSLISNGMLEEKAWNIAIREVILGLKSD